MTRLHAIACAALVAATSAAMPSGDAAAQAQTQLLPLAEAPPAPVPVLRPFTAQYQSRLSMVTLRSPIVLFPRLWP